MPSDVVDIQVLPLGSFQTNCYVVRPAGEQDAWVFDPGQDPQPLLEHLARLGLRVVRILITHGHGDHIAGVTAVKTAFPQAIVTAPAGDAAMLGDPVLNASAALGFRLVVPPADELVQASDELSLGATCWHVLDTSGHTPGGVSYHCPQAGIVIVGDALFAGSVGRCDIPGADWDRLIGNIRRNLLTLPPDTTVLPGHGPPTTIAQEAADNPYVGGK